MKNKKQTNTISLAVILFSGYLFAEPLEIQYFSKGNPINSTIEITDVENDLKISTDQLSIVRKDNQFNINVNLGINQGITNREDTILIPSQIGTGENFTFSNTNGQLNFKPSDVRFSATNMAYWLNYEVNMVLNMGYLKSSPMQISVYGQCKDSLEGLFNQQNNLICVGNQYKTLGQYALNGMTSLGLDADVIAHEMGHGILTHITRVPVKPEYPSFGNEMFGAMNEGQADFFAHLTTGTVAIAPWYMEIIKENYKKTSSGDYARIKDQNSLRFIAHKFNMRENFYGLIHEDGTIWAGTLYDIAKEIGKKKTLSLWLYALSKLNEKNNFFDAANLMLEADSKIFNGENTETLKSKFSSRGIFDQGSSYTPLKKGELKLTYTINDNSDDARKILESLKQYDNKFIDDRVDGMNDNGQLDPDECAILELKFTNLSDRKLVGLEMFAQTNLGTKGLANFGQARVYLGYLDPKKSFPEKIDLTKKGRPWLMVCAIRTYTSGGIFPIMVRNLSEGEIKLNVEL